MMQTRRTYWKKTKNEIYLTALCLGFVLLSLLSGCEMEPLASREDAEHSATARHFMISALSEGASPDTRTELSPDGRVRWGTGDSIAVVCGGVVSKFTSANDVPSDWAEFLGVLPAGTGTRTVTAYYPYRAGADSRPLVPSLQSCRAGSFSACMSPMAACATVEEGETFADMRFFNLASGLKFSLTRSDITRITFRSVGGEAVAGPLELSFPSAGEAPLGALSGGEGVSEIVLVPEETPCFPAGEWLYLLVAPVTLDRGFALMFETSDGQQAAIRHDAQVAFRRSVWKRASSLDASLTWSDAPVRKPLTPNPFKTRNVRVSSGSNETYVLTVSGADPYVYTWPNLSVLDADLCVLEFDYASSYAIDAFEVFYAVGGSVTGLIARRYGPFAPTDNFVCFSADISGFRALGWGDSINDCLRLDPGDSGSGTLKLRGLCVRGRTALEQVLAEAPSDGPWKEPLMEDKFWLCDGKLQIGVDLDRGGSIFHFSEVGTKRNLVNHADEGRLVQQSYYGAGDGSSWNGKAWPWNPIQGGGSDGTGARVLEQRMAGDTLVIVSEPVNWGTGPDGRCRRITEATMTSRIYLHPDGYAEIDYTFDYFGETIHPVCSQEMPAFFCDWDLPNLVYYDGAAPWTGDALTSVVPALLNDVTNPNAEVVRTEEWAAYVDGSGWGIGIYTPGTPLMIFYRAGTGPGGAFSPSCSYLAAIRSFAVLPGSTVNYRVYLKIGTVEEIRSAFSALDAARS